MSIDEVDECQYIEVDKGGITDDDEYEEGGIVDKCVLGR